MPAVAGMLASIIFRHALPTVIHNPRYMQTPYFCCKIFEHMGIDIRNDWTVEEVHDIYNTPLLELIYKAATVHKEYNDTAEVQVCTLLLSLIHI